MPAGVGQWLRRLVESPGNQTVVYCFPHAGAAASVYLPLAKCLPAHLDVAAVQLPGRADRMLEPPATDARVAARAAAAAIQADLAGRDCVLFGHSMGALLAFLTAHELRLLGIRTPRLLVVSGREAPNTRGSTEFWSDLSDLDLLAKLDEIGGQTAELREYAELRALALPTLRADLRLLEQYDFQEEVALECPVLVLGGTADPVVPAGELRGWSGITGGGVMVRALPGDHFFLYQLPGEVAGLISAQLPAWVW